MPRITFHKHNRLSKVVINTIALGFAMTSPYFGIYLAQAIAKEISKQLGPDTLYDPEEIRKSLYHLKRNKFIQYGVLPNNKIQVELTNKGKKRFHVHKFDDLKMPEPQKWDEKWRIVVFDIPEKKRLARDALRDKLKRLGFFQIQKSVLAYPFDCSDEIDFICEYFGVGKYVLTLTAPIKNDYYLRKYFNVKFKKYKLETGIL